MAAEVQGKELVGETSSSNEEHSCRSNLRHAGIGMELKLPLFCFRLLAVSTWHELPSHVIPRRREHVFYFHPGHTAIDSP